MCVCTCDGQWGLLLCVGPIGPMRCPTVDKGSCSTWGTGHFSTFDNYLYDFSGKCNYVFATICDDVSPDFNIQLRRGENKKIKRIIIHLGPNVITVENGVISINTVGIIKLPYARNGIQIMPFGHITRLVAKLMEIELAVFWNNDDYLMVLIEQKYMTRTCGLCGNFDGEELNEFLNEGNLLDPYKYIALQKIDDPTEICPYEQTAVSNARICSQLLSLVSPSCNVSRKEFVIRCQLDMQDCSDPGQKNCVCVTLSEYSRQCAMSHQEVSNWRSSNFCSLGSCPANQIYQECGSPCLKTCSNPDYICSSYCTYGCFCPEGTVLDDISSNRICVPIEQCPCMLNGKIYAPGDTMKATCRTCKCTMGQWSCTELPCPGRCSLEGGSFITTFDSKPYRFHGVCTYILMKSPMLPHNGTLMGVYEKSGYSSSETSLTAIIYVSGKVSVHGLELAFNNLYNQSSTHLQMYTTFGLELVIQVYPLLQVYIKVGLQFKGNTRGLCGNYNGESTDDFMTSMDIIEGTAPLFVDSWRLENCPPSIERDTDPCSMSQLNKMCAETHCSVLIKKDTIFEKCHVAVNPAPFYKRCVYQACNYEETFPYICSALASYARVCASMGVILGNWRSTVDNCTVPCTGNQTFSYDTQACDRTCLSLSHRDLECYPSDIPIDGCNCPKGTYLNHKNECVRKSQCPCYLKGRKLLHADQSTVIDGVTCYCIHGNLSCTGKPVDPARNCRPPKKYISCSAPSGSKYGAACAPTCQMLATGIDCVPSKCESGCVCEAGLYEKLDGTCVPPEDCPCEYGGISYAKGEEIRTDCKTCTCTRGKWDCIQNYKCSSTCTLYGEGHISTFDGQRFVFDGNCEYILAMDGCDLNGTPHTFKIVTENVVCGNTGVTCSRAIKIYLGNMTITLTDRTYTVSGMNPLIDLFIEENTLHLIFEISIPGKYDITLVWNKHMNIFIKIFREAQDHFCGLCGNYNGNIKDDFETRSRYLASNELEFVNSWKENPLCGAVSFLVDPCSKNPYRKAWAQKKCSIINSQVFASCHSKVYRMPYYEACVRDSCGCDTGGDCECMCDAIAVYAKACLEAGVCIDWRAPDFCPVYCDYLNSHKKNSMDGTYSHYVDELNCTWHYRPCKCPSQLQSYPYVNLEGNIFHPSKTETVFRDVTKTVKTTISMKPTTKKTTITQKPTTTVTTLEKSTITQTTRTTKIEPTPTTISTVSTPKIPTSKSRKPTTSLTESTSARTKTTNPITPTQRSTESTLTSSTRRPTSSPETTKASTLTPTKSRPTPTTTPTSHPNTTRTIATTPPVSTTHTSTSSSTPKTTPTPLPSTTTRTTSPTTTSTTPKTTPTVTVPSTTPTTATRKPPGPSTAPPTTSTETTTTNTPTPTTSTPKPTPAPTSSTSPETTRTVPTTPPVTTAPPSTSTVVSETTPTPTLTTTRPSTPETTTPATTPVTVSKGKISFSPKLNIAKKRVDMVCECCMPLTHYKKEVIMPCPDPDNPEQPLSTEIIIFGNCVCNSDGCTH
uniref:Mucin 6, oligomeric mucus/gel-forming/pseudo n=1 Tax=Salvator merianae TaxID=96440 RepID=A0A8D0C5U3_SALMN